MNNMQEHIGRVGFVGAGKVGFSLGRYWMELGVDISGYYSRHVQSAKEAATFTNSTAYDSLENLVSSSDTIFLTVPDGAIEDVWSDVLEVAVDIGDKVFCHTSGAKSSQVFLRMRPAVKGYSIHPLCAISHKLISYQELSNSCFTIEGPEGPFKEAFRKLLQDAGNGVECIASDQKALYHAAAVVVSNFVLGLSYMGSEMLKICGFSEEGAEKALHSLLLGNVHNILRQGAVQALTGPVERNDVTTVESHLAAFDDLMISAKHYDAEATALTPEEMKQLYTALTALLIKVGQKRHPETDYDSLQHLLEANKTEV